MDIKISLSTEKDEWFCTKYNNFGSCGYIVHTYCSFKQITYMEKWWYSMGELMNLISNTVDLYDEIKIID